MYLNEFSADAGPLDLGQSGEFASLLQSAADLGIPHNPAVRYVSRNVVLNHLRLHVLEWGDPGLPTVLLLHGGNQSAHAWDLVSLHLADRYHVLALDQRGHGDSEWTREADYSAPAMARDARMLLEREGVTNPIVIGHSMGGQVALTLTVADPQLARALVIVDVGPVVSEEGARTIGNFVTRNVEFDSIEAFVEQVAGYDPFRQRAHMERTARYNLVQRVDGKYISKSDRILHDESFRKLRAERAEQVGIEAVREIGVPTLVVRGERSNILTVEAAEEFAAVLSDGSLVTVPDCGHNVQTQNTTGFLAAVRPFLDRISSGEPQEF